MHKIYQLAAPFAPILQKFPKLIISTRFRLARKRPLQKPPISFYDKIIWLSFNTDTHLWSELADKYAVRKFVARKCGEDILTKLYGVYDNANEIDFNKLPDSFVLKTNNGCTTNVFVRDKKNINPNAIRRQFNQWMKFPYGVVTGQKHYSRITPKIIAEELLYPTNDPSAMPIDYKFYCFHGAPIYCFVTGDRIENTHKVKIMMYDMNWNPVSGCFLDDSRITDVPPPRCFEKMKSIASKLASDFPFVRVDLYDVNDQVFFGEMTFMPGMEIEYTAEFERHLGDKIKLPTEK